MLNSLLIVAFFPTLFFTIHVTLCFPSSSSLVFVTTVSPSLHSTLPPDGPIFEYVGKFILYPFCILLPKFNSTSGVNVSILVIIKLLEPYTFPFSSTVLAITFVGSSNLIGPTYAFHVIPLSIEYSFLYSSV